MANDLRIQVIVDGSQITAGMAAVTADFDAATARIKAAFGSVADAPVGIQNALKVLQYQSRMSAETVAFATSAIAELGQESAAAGAEVEELGNKGLRAGGKLASAGALGRAGFQALNSELGIRTNRSLGLFISQSETLGPLLAKAFSGIAIMGFAQLAVLAGEKLSNLIDEAFIFTKAEQDMYAGQVKLNAEMLKFDEQHKKALREIQLIGLSTVEQAKLKAQWAEGDETSAKELVDQKTKELHVETQNLTALKDKLAMQETLRGLAPEHGGPSFEDLGPQIRDQEVKIKNLNGELGDLQGKLRAAGDAAAESGKHFKVDQLKAHEQAVEHARESLERYTAATQRLASEQDRLKRSEQQLAEQQKEFGARQDDSQAIEESKGLIERNDAERQFQQDRIADEKQGALAEIALAQDKVKELSRLGAISATQEAQRLNALEDQKLVIEKMYLQKRINEILARLQSDDEKTYKEDLKEWSKLLTDKQKAEQEYQKKRQQNAANAAVSEQKTWEKMIQGINRMMDMAVQGIVTGTETLGKAFGNMIDGMLAKFIEGMLQMLEQWIVTHVLMVAVKKSAQEKEVLSDAKAAAAAAWKAVVGIPIIGPVLAPVAAATAFAGVEAFSAAGGMDFVPADNTLALLHQREMVLPASIADSIRGMTRFAGQGGAGASAGAGSGGATVNLNYAPSFAGSATDFASEAQKHSKDLVKILQRELRRSNAI